MNTRQRYILNLLNFQDQMTIEFLAQSFDVSVRTIRNDIEKLNDYLEPGTKKVNSIKSGNIFIENPTIIRMFISEHISDDYYINILTPRERQQLILLDLLLANEALVIENFSEKYSVTRNIILSDMDAIRDLLSEEVVKLLSKRGVGYWIEANELDRRNIITKIFREKQLMNKEYLNNSSFSNLNFYSNIFHEVDISEIVTIVRETENQLCFELSGLAFESLTLHLALSIQRNSQRKEDVYPEEIDFEIDIPPESIQYIFAQNVLELVKERFDINLPLVELKYVALHVNGREQFIEDTKDDIDDLYLRLILVKFISSVGSEIGFQLENDQDLLKGLTTHVQSSIVRYRNNISLDNPILRDIEDDYDYLFEIIKSHIGNLESYVGSSLNKNELSYFVIYFAAAIERNLHSFDRQINSLVVCGSGYGTAQLVKEQIERFFNINIVATTSALRIKKLIEENEIDLIISTTKINDAFDVPLVQVRPIFQSDDIQKIAMAIERIHPSIKSEKQTEFHFDSKTKREIIKILRKSKHDRNLIEELKKYIEEHERKQVQLMLSDLLHEEYINLDVDIDNWQDAIRQAGVSLVEHNVINNQYVEDCISSVKEMGPYIVITKHVAIPHAVNNGNVKQTAISLTRLKNPVNFGNPQNDPVKYVFMLATTDGNAHLKALTDLVELLSNDEFIHVINNAETEREIFEYIKEFNNQEGRNAN